MLRPGDIRIIEIINARLQSTAITNEGTEVPKRLIFVVVLFKAPNQQFQLNTFIIYILALHSLHLLYVMFRQNHKHIQAYTTYTLA